METLGKPNTPEALRLRQPTVSFLFSISAASNAVISVCLQVGLKYIQFHSTPSLFSLGYSTATSKNSSCGVRDLLNEIK